jgi:Fic family protein
MEHFLTWFQESKDRMDGVIRAGVAHLWFETLHPFEDGNGRVGRVIIDMALAQDNGQSTRLIGISRRLAQVHDDYYRYLEQAQKGDLDITGWLEWFIRQYHAACTESTAILDRSLQKAQYWMRHSGTSLSKAQRKVVNGMLDAGPESFDGGMSTKKYVSLAMVSTATASRDLGALLRAGLVVTTGQGKSTRYWINLTGWVPTKYTKSAPF